MTDNDKHIWINTPLSAEHFGQFEQIQRHLGMNNRTDVVRYLIAQEFRRIAQTEPVGATHASPAQAR